MANKKSQRRRETRDLKYTGLPLPIRARIAKLHVRGDGYMTVDLLIKSGATVIKSWGCECCDPYYSKEWDYKGRRFGTKFGLLDRKLSELLQRQHAEKNPPGVPLGELLRKLPPTVEVPIDIAAEQAQLKKMRKELLEARVATSYLESNISRTADRLVSSRMSVTHLAHGDWDCKDSPTGCCAYDDNQDPIHDFCLFCGDPEERK